MGTVRLGPKYLRRISRTTGLDVIRAWGWGGYTFGFVTSDHRHGYWHKRDQSWEFADPNDRWQHVASCRELFPGYDEPR
jgi:hypothetical protein